MPDCAASARVARVALRRPSTAIAVPWVSRSARRQMKPPSGDGTRRPYARVCAFGPRLGALGALVEGLHDRRTAGGLHGDEARPSRRGSSRARAISSNAFHMPTRPVPPPVG